MWWNTFFRLFHRIEINSPANYTLLKQGSLGAAGDIIDVKFPAHPNILSEPVYFWNATFSQISFTSKSTAFPGNTITLYPSKRLAAAKYFTGDYELNGIPSNYTAYALQFEARKNVSSAEFNRIFQWQNTTFLAITDANHHQFPLKLAERVDGLSGLKSLKTLKLMVHESTYKTFDVRPFLEKLTSLNNIFCRPYFLLGSDKFKEFVARQQLPQNWQSQVYIFKGQYRVHFSKKAYWFEWF